MLPLDVERLLADALKAERRPPDGLLHASSHLLAPMRHVQLELAGAPQKPRDLVGDVRLKTGTFWHSWFEQLFRGQPVMTEVKLDRWMPEGWSGTADWLFYDPDYKAFVLGDLKTIKGEGLHWIESKGAKQEHLWQLSAYYHALVAAGIPMVKGFAVFYLPMNAVSDKKLMPSVQECEVLPEWQVRGAMEHRWDVVQEYLASIVAPPLELGDYVTDLLHPIPPREQRLLWSSKQAVWEVKLVPHWSSMFCPFDDELCPCGADGTTKIGEYGLDAVYRPRKGYEEVAPSVVPSSYEINRRKK